MKIKTYNKEDYIKLSEKKKELESKTLEANKLNSIIKNKRTDTYFEEFDAMEYEKKADLDAAYYHHLFKNCPDEYRSDVEILINEFMDLEREIYERTNIKPRGFKENFIQENGDILDDTRKVIVDFIKHNYYNNKSKLNKNEIIDFSKDLVITEGIDPERSIEISTKFHIMKNLISQISMSKKDQLIIEDMYNNIVYEDIYDQEYLSDLMYTYTEKLKELALISSKLV